MQSIQLLPFAMSYSITKTIRCQLVFYLEKGLWMCYTTFSPILEVDIMYKKIEQCNTDIKYNNIGKEKMFMTDLADFEIKDERLRLFSLVQVKPGEEVEYHMHVGESETYFILSGRGIYNDNGSKVEAVPGMVTLTPSGEGHGLKNTCDEPLVFIALILLD